MFKYRAVEHSGVLSCSGFDISKRLHGITVRLTVTQRTPRGLRIKLIKAER